MTQDQASDANPSRVREVAMRAGVIATPNGFEDPPELGPNQYHIKTRGMYLAVEAPSPALYRAKSLFWLRVIGAAVLAWIAATIIATAFLATEMLKGEDSPERPAESAVSASTYDECLASSTTTLAECEALR